MIVKTSIYLHGSKESNYEHGAKLGLTGPALDNFMYACYEVNIGLNVDTETGAAEIISVDDKPLERRS